MSDGPQVDDLRRHLDADAGRGAAQGAAGGGPAGGACPTPEDWWRGWRGDSNDEAFGRLVDHAAGCPDCSLLSRVAREMVLRLEPKRYRGAPRPAPWMARATFAAAAAAVIAVLGLTIGPWRGGRGDSTIRTQEETPLASLLDETAVLARADCRLRWSAGPEGTVYNVEVTDESLRSILSVRSLTTPDVQVPAASLSGVPPGGRILWQVEGILPDGRRLASRTHFTRLD